MGLADSKFKVTLKIREKLLSDPEIVKLIDDQVFPVIAPKDTKGDFIIYQRDKYEKERSKMMTARQTCEVYINAISDDYDRSQELAYLIDKCLDPDVNCPDANLRAHLIDSTEDYEDGKFIQILLFEIQ